MSDFINTIDIVGDDVLCGSILDRSVTEFKDNKITKVGDFAFYQCKALVTVDIPSVTVISQNAFDDCESLTCVKCPSLTTFTGGSFFRNCTLVTTLDFPSLTSKVFGSSFYGCTSLVALILRSSEMLALEKVSAFTGSAIANGTGYIYVPSALVSTYQSATNWSTYADQFRALEDYTVDGTITGELDESKI